MADTIFTPITSEDKVVYALNRITNAMWSNGSGILSSFFTSSTATFSPPVGQDKYYLNIYGSSTAGSPVEFSIAYGQETGLGAPYTDYDYPTKAIYDQYRNLLLSTPTSKFTYLSSGNTVTMTNILVIALNRSNYKQKIDKGNWQLRIGRNNFLNLIDDSNDALDANALNNAKYYTVVSGSVTDGRVGTAAYGLVYPDYGLILLNATDISNATGIQQYTGTSGWVGAQSLTNLQAYYGGIKSGSYFSARSEELISSTHYFIRVKNKNYNYSTNPSFYSSSDGTIINPLFYNDPHTFITTVGLYNDDNELLAVAKLSQPINKSFDREALIKCRLDF